MNRQLISRSHLSAAAAIARGYGRGHPSTRVGPRVKVFVRHGQFEACHATLGKSVEVSVYGTETVPALLRIGKGSSIGDRSIINASKSVIIGTGTLVSWNCQILDTDFHAIAYEDGTCPNPVGEVVIGNNVWIGTSTIVLKNSVIDDNVVIGAGSVVSGHIESGWLAAGNPARPIKRISRWT